MDVAATRPYGVVPVEAPGYEPAEAVLRDGTRVVIRPLTREDAPRLLEGFERLSPQSRYLRFHAPLHTLSGKYLQHLTDLSGDHMALVAYVPERPDVPGLGVARYVRLADQPDAAEIAITVLDEYQGRGLAPLLIQELAKVALLNGIRTFRGYVLVENAPMLRVFEKLGSYVRRWEGNGVYRVDLPLAPRSAVPE